MREASGDAAVHNHILAQPHLGTQAQGILAAERPPVGRNREPLVPGQRAAAKRNRHRRAFERLPHLGLQGADLRLQRGHIGLQAKNVLPSKTRRCEMTGGVSRYHLGRAGLRGKACCRGDARQSISVRRGADRDLVWGRCGRAGAERR